MTVQRSSHLWIVWSVLVVILLNMAITFPPEDLSFPQFSSSRPIRHSQASIGHDFFEVIPSLSQESVLQGERQSRKVLMLLHRFDDVLQKQKRAVYGQLAPVLLSHFIRFFLPRKISSPSTTDEPFLS